MTSIEQYKEMIDAKLDHLIPSGHSSLYEGGRYTLLAPCKRIRPLLTLVAAEMLQKGGAKKALYPACALEMVHTYSLIHYDLPCMDDDNFRRGQPTLHQVYNDGHAVLVGDYLLTYAFEVLASAPLLSTEQKLTLVKTLAKAAGDEGMVGGQVMDLEDSPLIEEMHRRKTAALFQAALEFGGISTHCSPSVLHTLKLFGTQFGQLFQIVDDILDEEEQPLQAMSMFYQKALETLDTFPGDASLLKLLLTKVVDSIQSAPLSES